MASPNAAQRLIAPSLTLALQAYEGILHLESANNVPMDPKKGVCHESVTLHKPIIRAVSACMDMQLKRMWLICHLNKASNEETGL